MRKPFSRFAILALAAATAACATSTTGYRWGNYDEALYAHYKNPQDQKAYLAALKAVIQETDRAGTKIPPGIYAEYGFALYESGSTADAITYFQREANAWPESKPFMEKMIANAQRQPGQAPATGPAGSAERKAGS
ncbi:MAG: DUF4810 domain-containing protein [Deltaproteobacteria bacterium]